MGGSLRERWVRSYSNCRPDVGAEAMPVQDVCAVRTAELRCARTHPRTAPDHQGDDCGAVAAARGLLDRGYLSGHVQSLARRQWLAGRAFAEVEPAIEKHRIRLMRALIANDIFFAQALAQSIGQA